MAGFGPGSRRGLFFDRGKRVDLEYLLLQAIEEMSQPRKGWVGSYATTHVPGAYKNGTRIQKQAHEEGDAHPVGTLGTVLGSLSHPEKGIAYFVEWDPLPRHAVLVIARKLAAAA